VGSIGFFNVFGPGLEGAAASATERGLMGEFGVDRPEALFRLPNIFRNLSLVLLLSAMVGRGRFSFGATRGFKFVWDDRSGRVLSIFFAFGVGRNLLRLGGVVFSELDFRRGAFEGTVSVALRFGGVVLSDFDFRLDAFEGNGRADARLAAVVFSDFDFLLPPDESPATLLC